MTIIFRGKLISVLSIFVLINYSLYAQDMADTTFLLQEIQIVSKNSNAKGIGQNIFEIESDALHNEVEGLPFILLNHSHLHLKTYALGGIASLSLRGNSSSQTNVVWNGIPINSPLLGESDLSGICQQDFSEVSIYPNGKLSFLGHNAAGGDLLLESNLQSNKKIQSSLTQTLGNKNLWQTSLQVKAKIGRWHFSIQPFTQSLQDFYEIDRKGTTMGLQFQINDNNRLKVNAWAQKESSDRKNTSFHTLSNDFFRSVLDWQHSMKHGSLHSDLSFVDESQSYGDSAYSFKIVRHSTNFSKSLFGKFRVASGYMISNIEANSTGFIGHKNRFHFHAYIDGQAFLGKRTKMQINIKKGISRQKQLPIIFSMGIDHKLANNKLQLKAFVGSKYRQPTFNDLYWYPGGNPELEDEKGFSMETSLHYKKNDGNKVWETSHAFFFTKTNNKILWIPRNTLFKPINIRDTQSAGIESKISFTRYYRSNSLHLSLFYSYTQAKNKSQTSIYDRSYNKQLPYIPLHKMSVNSRYNFNNYTFSFLINATDKTFTSVDNKAYLNAYFINHLRIIRKIDFKNNQIKASLGLNNIWNTNYEVVEGYPAPGRQIYISINYQFYKN